jgi:hypothetical protein
LKRIIIAKSTGRGVGVSVVTKVLIDASQVEVFKYLAHLNYHLLWNPHIYSITPLTALKLGTRYESESLILGVSNKSTNEVIKFVALSELELENKLGAIHYRINFRLSLKATKTMIVCSTTVSTESKAFTYTAPILKRLVKRELQSDMQALKIAIEDRL